ncbi:peptidase MA family metallohydrolase [Natronincola ferrireducens]|uniref:Peptidase MA-like domain-containing protein n=1 Tax=Natronincola ferrireducens TaxID=393762 RepID=A0A1G9HMC9_9FIRM|nr:hypothetical protein [Natronincola ferrireducens]SDL14137.1 hypothetical protein SAMN05660472_02682 [Natronincola ferrireducens]
MKTKEILLKVFMVVSFLSIIGFAAYRMYPSSTIATLRPMLRGMENTIVSYRVGNYDFITTEHFIICYDDGIDQEIVDLVAKTAEDKYRTVEEVFQYKTEEKILVVLYDDPRALMRNTMLRQGPVPMGVYYGDSIHLLNPVHWVKDLEEIDRIFYSQGPFLHELVHLFTDHVAKGNFPLWFTEGISLYFEYMVDEYEWGKDAVFEDEEYTLDILTKEFHQLDDYLAYTQSFRIIRDFVDIHGIEALLNILRDLGEGKDIKEFIHLF